jgi:predicted secreted hydrolase
MPKPIFFGVGPEFLRRDGLSETIAPWEDGLRADTGRGSFEWWYFDAHLDDGSTAVIVFATKPLLERNGPLKPSLIFTITRPDGHKLDRSQGFTPDQFSAAKDGCDVRLGGNYVHGNLHRYELHAANGDLAADLTFVGSVPPWRPGSGKNYYNAALTRYFAWLPAIPYGTVQGTLTYDGQTHAVSGVGYHDHNWGNVGLNEVMSHWYWGRAQVGAYSLIFVEMNAVPAYGGLKIPVFLLAKDGEILIGDGTPLKLTTSDLVTHPEGRSYPRQLDFHWQSADASQGSVHLQLRQPELIEAISLLTTFPRWQQRLLRLVANPYYFRFNAALELRLDLPGLQTVESGRALYEIMLLR